MKPAAVPLDMVAYIAAQEHPTAPWEKGGPGLAPYTMVTATRGAHGRGHRRLRVLSCPGSRAQAKA